MAAFRKIASLGDIPPGRARMFEIEGKKIAVFNVEGSFYAIDDACTHQGGPLSEGDLSGTEVTCPWHGAVFDVTTGEVLSPPAPTGITSYPTRVEGSDLKIEV